ncbi:MAG: HTH-type transcriptional regulator [uncultured Aureispira sp.]|uniref:HTH-type transcriptional regulator n=1 Tax=uncultured Aureispira sp. TaxID=1331704 RepID=A0A6S6T886_9BACT|nr:MAG: HTH-type transcriptional regulator [uncultured Aureispira sp.]
MELDEAKQRFIQAWGTLGSNWGINRTMAQVHALLLISAEALCADDIMEKLKISRGNANMNIRALIDWGLVFKELKPGERREYFISEKDMWNVVRQIIIHRKKKELEPVLRVLNDVSDIEGDGPDQEAFLDVIKEIQLFASKADKTLDKLVSSDANWLMKTFMKMM